MAKKQEITKGRAYIQASYNNTRITITDPNGNILAWATAGGMGFKGPKKATPYAATQVAYSVINKIKSFNMRIVDVYIKGIGHGRESAIRGLNSAGLIVESISDITPMPHNGPRPKKPRRV